MFNRKSLETDLLIPKHPPRKFFIPKQLQKLFGYIFCLSPFSLVADGENLGLDSPAVQLFHELKMVETLDQKLHDQLPLLVNSQLQGGYFTMPSARTFDAGVLGLGFSDLPPYYIWSMGFQFFDHVEATGNYWIYKGITESAIGRFGFGDDAERSANVKFIFLRREDGFPDVPNIAVGWNDFFGSKRFHSFYAAATQQFLDFDLETTLGWGAGRIKGPFAGLAWSPFRKSSFFWKNLILAAEYDANDYKHHGPEHPEGRRVKSRINVGMQLPCWDILRLTVNTVRGDALGADVFFHYNIGASKGLFPKTYDPPLYTAPVVTEPLGLLRTRQDMAQEIAYAFKEQGFDLSTLYLIPSDAGKDELWMKVINVRYREEEDVRDRLERILAALTPANVVRLTVVMEADGVATQEYRFRALDLQRYREGRLGSDEFRVIAPLRETSSSPTEYDAPLLYQRRKPIWCLTFRPWVKMFFGTRHGKFKHETGFLLGSEGYLLDQIYYGISGSYTVFSSAQNVGWQDFHNPSRIINVRTDALRYHHASSFHLDQAYLQRSWNWGAGWFSRLALGYFETAYGGVAAEALYYPVCSDWAIGFEAATVWKREYCGLGFQHKIRKWTEQGEEFFPYVGVQYFVDFYYEFKPLHLDFKVSAGQFLARDKGIRIEGARTFPSGLRFGLWYTLTNGNDLVHGSRYYDRGFFFTLPFDFFLNKSSRTRLSYAMSAWLRDVGAQSATGKPLYPTLYWERYNYEYLLR